MAKFREFKMRISDLQKFKAFLGSKAINVDIKYYIHSFTSYMATNTSK